MMRDEKVIAIDARFPHEISEQYPKIKNIADLVFFCCN